MLVRVRPGVEIAQYYRQIVDSFVQLRIALMTSMAKLSTPRIKIR